MASLDLSSRPLIAASHQPFLTTLTTTPLGAGPALTVTTAVPDKHQFRGSFGGKDVIPLYRDADAAQPNITRGLLDLLADRYDGPVTPEDFAAYVAGVLAHPGDHARFAVELATPGPRVPLTADAELFAEVRDLGRRLLWLQTWTERYRDAAAGRGADLPAVAGLGWASPVAQIPATERDVTYSAATQTVHVGTGTVTGVRPDVWAFQVSG